MTSGEPHEFGEDTRDLAEGLRRLAEDVQTPPDVLPSVLAQSEQFFPARQNFWARLTRATWRWFMHPAVWSPALALASFVAGLMVAPSQLDTPSQTLLPEKQEAVLERQASPPPAAGLGQDRAWHDTVTMPRQAYRQDSRARSAAKTTAPVMPAPAEPETTPRQATPPRREPARSTSPYVAVSEERERFQPSTLSAQDIEVAVSLPPALYERLMQRADGHEERLADIVREAVEAYVRARDTEK